MNDGGAARGDALVIDPTKDRLGGERTARASTIGALRRAHGLTVPPPTQGLDRMGRLVDAAFDHWHYAAAHAALAYRTTCYDGAAVCARDALTRWLTETTDADLRAWADELVTDAADHERRATTPWRVPPPGDDDAPGDDHEAAA